MRVIAITGDMASGKSTVAHFLAQVGEIVIDTDQITHQLDKKSAAQRQKLATQVFSNENLRQKLNHELWPRIKTILDENLASYRAQNITRVFVQVPRLFETDWLPEFDEIWLISAKSDLRRARLRARGLTSLAINARLNLAFDPKNVVQSTKIKLTELENNDTISALKQKTLALLSKI